MANNWDLMFKKILTLEGGYVNHIHDRGGQTKFGITEKLAKVYGYNDIKLLTEEQAKEIYCWAFWKPLKLDIISNINFDLADALINAAINIGIITTGKWLQKSLNLLNLRNKNLVVDGIIGPKTLDVLSKLQSKDFKYLISLIKAFQLNHYINLCDSDDTQKVFLRGWINRVNS